MLFPSRESPLVMGVLNVTPDSFSDGGLYLDENAAVAHGIDLVRGGAAIVDVGGESTRPGAEPVAAREELARVLPVVRRLVDEVDAAISIDTSKLAVAEAALAAGATIVNDVTALRNAPEIASLVAADDDRRCILMHMLGEPRTMQDAPRYDDVVSDVKAFLARRLEWALARGVGEEQVWLDPGIGFGKTAAHNLELIRRLDEIVALGRPVVIGASRKSFLGRLTGHGERERDAATVAANVLAYERGATVFRVHEARACADAVAVAAATVTGAWKTTRTA